MKAEWRKHFQSGARRRTIGASYFLLAMALAFAAVRVSAGSREEPAGVVAVWRHGELERVDYESWRTYRGLEDSPEAIRELVFLTSLASHAAERGLEADPRVRLEIESMRQRILMPALRRHVTADLVVRDEEVESLRREHPEAFRRSRKLRLRNLYKRLGDGPEAVRRRMHEIHRELLEGADFGELARRESESQSAPRGGKLGFVAPEELPPPVAEAARKLVPGAITSPIEHGDGMTILLCEEVREGYVPAPQEVGERLRQGLLRQRGKERWVEVQRRLLEEAVPRLDATSSERVLEIPGYELTAKELGILVSLRSLPGAGASAVRSDLEGLLRRWAIGVLSARRAQALGLAEDPAVAAALRWERLQILANRELAQRCEGRLQEPSPTALRRWLEAHPHRYRQPASYDLGVLYFGAKDGESPRRWMERAEAVARRLELGELSFEEAARCYSQHPSAAEGGGIGWRTRQQVAVWGPTARQAIRALSPGEHSRLLHLQSGLWIFELRAVRDAHPQAFEGVRDQIRRELLQQQLGALRSELGREHLDGLDLRIFPAPSARVVRWSTASELESFGYHVYRGNAPDGPFERLTMTLILGAGTTDVPQHYRFVDEKAEPGAVYYYYVESISTSGRRKRLTPIRRSGDGE